MRCEVRIKIIKMEVLIDKYRSMETKK